MNAFANALLDSSRAAAAVGPQICRPAAVKSIRDTEAQRHLGADDRQVGAFPLGEGEQGVGVVQVDGGCPGTRRAMPGFPGAQMTAVDVGIGREPADQGVLARAAAEDENLHCLNELWRVTALRTRQGLDGDYFVDVEGVCA